MAAVTAQKLQIKIQISPNSIRWKMFLLFLYAISKVLNFLFHGDYQVFPFFLREIATKIDFLDLVLNFFVLVIELVSFST